MKFIEDNPVLVGGLLAVGIAAIWIATRGAKQAGKDIGGGAVNLAWGAGTGAVDAVVKNANDQASNPLYGFGSWVGGTIYNVTH